MKVFTILATAKLLNIQDFEKVLSDYEGRHLRFKTNDNLYMTIYNLTYEIVDQNTINLLAELPEDPKEYLSLNKKYDFMIGPGIKNLGNELMYLGSALMIEFGKSYDRKALTTYFNLPRSKRLELKS